MGARFSVLLSLYCKESPAYFTQAMRSIWHDQTMKPSQVVLVKDGPLTHELDAEVEYWISELGDAITIVALSHNQGLAVALNQGLQYCKYDLVARMDTDDIAMPERFKLQVEFMNSNHDIAVSSGFIEEWNSDFSMKISSRWLPLSHESITKFAKMRSPISHPASIFRKSVIIQVGGYPDVYPEDHLLWIRVLQSGFKLANLPKLLLRMRTGDDFITRRGFKFLKGELLTYHIMYRSNFLTLNQFFKVSILRSLVRLAPNFLKVILYKRMRSI
ncbi:glycosyltransferase [Aeromonas sp. s6]|uniref:glycosyltransferase n=1 Tax=Aeromonas sp. s6 TaxID=3138488 RepID=UPI0034A362E2